jgi:hypothetical protein
MSDEADEPPTRPTSQMCCLRLAVARQIRAIDLPAASRSVQQWRSRQISGPKRRPVGNYADERNFFKIEL